MDTKSIGRMAGIPRRTLVTGAAGVGATALLTFGSIRAAANGARNQPLRLAHSNAQGSQEDRWSQWFAQYVHEHASDVTVEVYPAAQLGQDVSIVQAVKMGAIDITVNGPALNPYAPMLSVFDIPFLYDDLPHSFAVQDGRVGRIIRRRLEDLDFHLLGWCSIGVRHVTNNVRPIDRAKDLAGLKLRVPPGKVFIQTFDALGVSVQSMDLSELYMALQQGVLDGQENPSSTIKVQKFYEVQKFMSLTSHIVAQTYPVMSLASYRRFPERTRRIFDEAGRFATENERKFLIREEKDALKLLRGQAGLAINTPGDLASFRSVTNAVVKSSPRDVRELVELVKRPS